MKLTIAFRNYVNAPKKSVYPGKYTFTVLFVVSVTIELGLNIIHYLCFSQLLRVLKVMTIMKCKLLNSDLGECRT
jgi:hypothetical protein